MDRTARRSHGAGIEAEKGERKNVQHEREARNIVRTIAATDEEKRRGINVEEVEETSDNSRIEIEIQSGRTTERKLEPSVAVHKVHAEVPRSARIDVAHQHLKRKNPSVAANLNN